MPTQNRVPVPIAHDEVHLWEVAIDQARPYAAALWRLLTADEQRRAERFHFDKDRMSFTVTRGTLRLILSHYLGTRPEELCLSYGTHGKPAVAKPHSDLTFNVSHSYDRALIGVARGRSIGVDVEAVRNNLELEQLAHTIFSRRELAVFQAIDPERRARAFFYGWTRKEAFCKALGLGLSFPVQEIEVSFDPAEPVQLISVRGEKEEARKWSLMNLDVGHDYAAAVAVAGHGCHLLRRQADFPRLYERLTPW